MLSIRKIGAVGRTYRHLNRYREILGVLFKYGFGDLIDSLRIEHYLEIGLQMISRKRRKRIEKLTTPMRLRMALEELGPTFVKMGQILSTRPDLVPMDYVHELEKLQDEVPPVSYDEVCQVIQSETGNTPEALFAFFDKEPLAAASIGQVHRARLQNKQEVVVKVQRPRIHSTVQVDLEILLHLAELMEQHVEELEIHRPTRVVEEFARSLEKEIDYTLEATNIERFAQQFENTPTIYVPSVYRDLTTPRMLTMEYIDGIKISHVDQLRNRGYDLHKLAQRGADLIMQQVFVHGFFHGDPHPGNVFVKPDNIICYLDFGMTGRINRQEREACAELILQAVNRDERKVVNTLLRLTAYDEEPDRKHMERDVAELIDRYMYRSLEELDVGGLLQKLMEVLAKHRLSLNPNLFLMIKALSAAEGIGRMLHPGFEVAKYAEPFIRRIHQERLNPLRMAADMLTSGTEIAHQIQEIPGELRNLLRQTGEGKTRIQFEHRGLDAFIFTLDRISSRIAFAIVLAALIIGSSLIVLSDIPPKWFEVPIIGLIGFILAGLMGFWLLVSILRQGRM